MQFDMFNINYQWYSLLYLDLKFNTKSVLTPNVLQKESPKADIERLILETGGVKSLIGCLHGISIMHKVKKGDMNLSKDVKSEEGERMCPIPDGLPKSADELREEEQARMPDSPYTKLLRTMGRHPAWYSPAPDHETDWWMMIPIHTKLKGNEYILFEGTSNNIVE